MHRYLYWIFYWFRLSNLEDIDWWNHCIKRIKFDKNRLSCHQRLDHLNFSKNLLLSCLYRSHKELHYLSIVLVHINPAKSLVDSLTKLFFSFAYQVYLMKLQRLWVEYWFICIKCCLKQMVNLYFRLENSHFCLLRFTKINCPSKNAVFSQDIFWFLNQVFFWT